MCFYEGFLSMIPLFGFSEIRNNTEPYWVVSREIPMPFDAIILLLGRAGWMEHFYCVPGPENTLCGTESRKSRKNCPPLKSSHSGRSDFCYFISEALPICKNTADHGFILFYLISVSFRMSEHTRLRFFLFMPPGCYFTVGVEIRSEMRTLLTCG